METDTVTDVTNSSVQPSVVVWPSNVSSPPDDEDVQVMEAAYERMNGRISRAEEEIFYGRDGEDAGAD